MGKPRFYIFCNGHDSCFLFCIIHNPKSTFSHWLKYYLQILSYKYGNSTNILHRDSLPQLTNWLSLFWCWDWDSEERDMDSKVVNKSTSSHENIGAVRTIIKLLLMAVYLGTLMIWVLMPTNTYRQNWLPHLRAKFGFTTYFGAQGW